MAARIVLVGLPADDAAVVRHGLPADVEVELSELGPGDSLAALTEDADRFDAIVTWDPGAGGAIAFAQRVARIDRDLPVFVVAPPERIDAVRRAVQMAPFVGPRMTVHSTAAIASLGEQVARAAELARSGRATRTEHPPAEDVPAAAEEPSDGYAEHVLRHAPIGLITVDSGGIVRAVNPEAARMLEVPGEQAIGVSFAELAAPELRSELARLLANASEQGAARAVLELADARFVEVSASRYLGPGHEPTTVVIAADVTDRERGAARLRDLQNVTDAALGSLDLDELLDELLSRIQSALAVDTAAVLLIDEAGRELRIRASRGLDPALHEFPIDVGRGFAGHIARTREPYRLTHVERHHVVEPRFGDAVASLLGVPLLVGDLLIGVLHVGSFTVRDFTDDDQALLELVAARVALGINQARMYAHEHETAEVLQRSLLPQRLAAVPGLELAARYLPGGAGIDVGGDWYDVTPLGGGRVALSIGDVVGRGLGAAAVMGHLRAALRAYAIEGHPPGAALQRLNELVVHGGRSLATAAHMTWSPDGRLWIASAGHPPPLLVDADGNVRFIDEARGPALGILPFATYDDVEVDLPPGGRVVLYTDGLVERRNESLDAGLSRMSEAAADAPRGPAGLADRLLERLLGDEADDDTALLVIEAPAVGAKLELELPVTPESLGVVRTHVRRWLREHDAPPDVAHDIVVASGEAVTNVVEHAYGPGSASFRVEAAIDHGSAVLTIRDHGHWREPRDIGRGRGTPMMHALMDHVETTTGDEGTTVRLVRSLRGNDREAAA